MTDRKWRLPAKSMSWQYTSTIDPHADAVVFYNGRQQDGRIEYSPLSCSWNARLTIRLKTGEGRVDTVEAFVSGLSDRDLAGREMLKQWFRRAELVGWYC
jgi:hypothetical protein